MNIPIVLCVGRTGSGKTSFLNLIRNGVVTGVVGKSDTKLVIPVNHQSVCFYDTPGLGDTSDKTTEAKSDSEIIENIRCKGKINVVFFFMSVTNKIDHTFAYRITEISHLYDVPFTHFCIIVTMMDTIKISDRENKKTELKQLICGKFGLIHTFFSGDYDPDNNPREGGFRDHFINEFNSFIITLRDMPDILPIHNYVSTDEIEQAKTSFLEKAYEQNNQIGKYIRKQELIKIRDSYIEDRRGFTGFFVRIGDVFNGNDIDDINKEINKIGEIDIPSSLEEKMEIYKRAYDTLDKEILKRRSKVRFILSQINDVEILNIHYDNLRKGLAILSNN